MRKIISLILGCVMILSLQTGNVHAADQLYSKYVYVSDLNGNEVYAKNADDEMYPASITKLLFCLVAYDQMSSNHSMNDYAGRIKAWDLTHAWKQNLYTSGMKTKERVTYNDLFHSILFKSGAEAAYALMRFTFKKESKAVQAMNKKCDELSMDDSHFTNVTGVQNDDQYTTAKDFSKVVQLAWNTPAIKNILLGSSYRTRDKKLRFLAPRVSYKKYCDKSLLGGKTGTTKKAQHTYAGFIKAQGQVLFTVTGHATLKVSQSHIRDERTLARIINTNYHMIDVTPLLSPRYTNLSSSKLLWRKNETPQISDVYGDDQNVVIDLDSKSQDVEISAQDTQYEPELLN